MNQERLAPQPEIAFVITKRQLLFVKIFVFGIVFFLPLSFLALTVKDIPVFHSRQVRTNQSNLSEAEKDKISSHLQRGKTFIENKQFSEGIEEMVHVLIADPENAQAWNNIGLAYALLGNKQTAVDSFQKALSIKPDFQLAKNNLAWVQGK